MGNSQSLESLGPTHRDRAAQSANLRAQMSKNSQAAYRAGNYAAASKYSRLASKHYHDMVASNRRASRAIFKRLNAGYPQERSGWGVLWSLVGGWGRDKGRGKEAGLAKLDLHGQFVNEALALVRRHVEMCRKKGVKKSLVVTGRGAHSPNGVARIKPEVEELLAGMARDGVRYWKDGEGAFVVEVGNGGGWLGRVLRGIFG